VARAAPCGLPPCRSRRGDPHALDVGTPLHRLTVSLLGAAAGLGSDASSREVWAAWNVLVDPISSNVAALNLPLIGNGSAAALARAVARRRGKPHTARKAPRGVRDRLRIPAKIKHTSCRGLGCGVFYPSAAPTIGG
jgi:hypothetical protein